MCTCTYTYTFTFTYTYLYTGRNMYTYILYSHGLMCNISVIVILLSDVRDIMKPQSTVRVGKNDRPLVLIPKDSMRA